MSTFLTTQNPIEQLPLAFNGYQFNHCKTLSCKNFGSHNPNDYVLQNNNRNRPTLVCRECGAFPPLLNNQDVVEETLRYQRLQSSDLPRCTNSECDNKHYPALTHRHLYHAFGFSGDRQRYRCKACEQTFVDRWSGANNKLAMQQKLLGLLFTGYPVRDICRRLEINPKTFYDQLNHIAARCRRQLALFDERLFKHQHHVELASNIKDLQPQSHNGVMWVASAESQSGYVVAQHINYHADDIALSHLYHDAYQDSARFMSAPKHDETVSDPFIPKGILAKVDATYRKIFSRSNMENPLSDGAKINYPTKGTLIYPQYTVYSHYLYLKEMFQNNEYLAIFMPQETLLRSACISVFIDHIKQKRIDPLYVIEDEQWLHGEDASKVDIVLLGWWQDRWAFTHLENASKGICHLGGETNDDKKWLKHATYRAVSSYQHRFQEQFSQLINEPRRKLRPAGLLPLLDIYRAWHNLCRQDKFSLTPAQRLGLASSPMTLEQLLS
ncbi:lactate dehydrogenase [Photobacterium leiognathi subsp. mandapamensis]|uniref:lactate dehydrogenase n=1 Tax=Photobacterium leiognathi TaxID=553611 RepID=UPI000D16C782|nr:lactate dehydrogenase [Photobacterium leiognathi]PSW65054.1 lactate dehydrogenase [Photobacterium leiognathi subsp. mandapamensis]